jgi:hypothetical protein
MLYEFVKIYIDDITITVKSAVTLTFTIIINDSIVKKLVDQISK